MEQKSEDVFVSYARDCKKTQELVSGLRDHAGEKVTFFQSEVVREGGEWKYVEGPIRFRYDETDLHYGESIQAFMDKVANARRLILIISDAYLRSFYCMYECLSAYNIIANRYYPAVVFVFDDIEEAEAILYFDDGLPVISTERFRKYWMKAKKRLEEENKDDPAIEWYEKYIRMADELDAWLVGRRVAGKPDRMLPVYRGGDEKKALDGYIERATSPLEHLYAFPTSDTHRERSINEVCRILDKNPVLEKKVNNGRELNGPEYRRRFAADLLDDPAGFITNKLAPALEDALEELNGPKLNRFREGADQLFGELVKFGLRVDSLHHQLQEVNQQVGDAPIAVASEATIPEMADAYLRSRTGAFRSIDVRGKTAHIGKLEYVVSKDNTLEIDESRKDALEQLNDDFFNQLGDLFYPDEVAPGPELLGQKFERSTDEFLITLDGFEGKAAVKMVEEYKQNTLLAKVRYFRRKGEQGNVVRMANISWFEAINRYYKARSA